MHPYPSLKDRVVVITGGGRGLGQVMTLALLAQGARVLITASRAPRNLDETVAAAQAIAPHNLRTAVGDVTDPAACQAVIDRAVSEFGRIDGLVNNAARPSWEASRARPDGAKKFWEADLDGFRRMVETNFTGQFQMARLAAPLMVAQGFGRIVNVSTSRSTMVAPSGSPYGACKAALEASSVMWAKDLAGTGVTVNVLLPGGPADTPLIPGPVGGRAMPGFAPGKGPLGQEGKVSGGLLPPEVMAAPILWLCADESSDYTGRRIVGRDWDPDLAPEAALAMAMQDKHDAPLVM